MNLAELSKNEWALSLFDYKSPSIDSEVFNRFYSYITEWAESIRLNLTYVAAEGDGYSGKLSKFGTRIRNRLIKSNFSGISVLALYANPEDSDEPSYDRFFSVSLSHVPEKSEVFLCLTLNDSIVNFGSGEFELLIVGLLKLNQWDFGQAFCDEIKRQPDFHLMGINNGALSPDELEALTKWYRSQPQERVKKLRAVYPYNLVNETQLKLNVLGKSLREVIEEDNDSQLKPTAISGLFLWTVKGDLSLLQNKLSSANVTIT